MTVLADYRAMLRDQVGPALRRHGFKGSRSRWIWTGPSGDMLIVSAQSSSVTTRDQVRFTMNLGVLPEAWNALQQGDTFRAGSKPDESDGLWRDRIPARVHGTPGYDSWWQVSDTTEVRDAGADVVAQLDETVVAALHHALRPDVMRQRLLDNMYGILDPRKRSVAASPLRWAVFLAHDGEVDEVDRLLADWPPDKAHQQWLRRHARERAQERRRAEGAADGRG